MSARLNKKSGPGDLLRMFTGTKLILRDVVTGDIGLTTWVLHGARKSNRN